MIYGYGARIDNDSNAITIIDEENRTAETTGYINGEYVEFSGGGSSDFSTAEVTVIGSGGAISGANIYDDENDDNTASYGVLESGVNTVVLYKGKAILYAQGEEISVSGSITDNEGVLTVTGNGTITIS